MGAIAPYKVSVQGGVFVQKSGVKGSEAICIGKMLRSSGFGVVQEVSKGGKVAERLVDECPYQIALNFVQMPNRNACIMDRQVNKMQIFK